MRYRKKDLRKQTLSAGLVFLLCEKGIMTFPRNENQTHSHHGAGARARHKHLASVGAVLADGVRDHVGDGVAVAATVVRQRRLGADVPAGAAVRAAGIDDDEAVLIGEGGELSTREKCRS